MCTRPHLKVGEGVPISTEKRIKCVVMGEGPLPLFCLKILIDFDFEIVGFLTPDSTAFQSAIKRGIPSFFNNQSQFPFEFFKEKQIDVIFSVVNYIILPKEFLETPNLSIINYHDGPLPKYAGTNATTWAIINREKEHGITWHKVVHKVDAGDIISQSIFPIKNTDTVLSLNQKCFFEAQRVFKEVIISLKSNTILLSPQKLTDRTFYSRKRKPPAGGLVDWNSNAEEIEAMLRGLNFGRTVNPLVLAKLLWKDEVIYPLEAMVTNQKTRAIPGSILAVENDQITVATTTTDLLFSKFLITREFNLISKSLPVGCSFLDVSSALKEEISEMVSSLAPKEKYWHGRLAGLIPLKERGENPFEPEAGCLALPLLDDDKIGKERLFIAFCVLVGSIKRVYDFDVGIEFAHSSSEPEVFSKIFETVLPFRFKFATESTFNDLLGSFVSEMASVKNQQTFLKDLIYRYPDLLAKVEKDPGCFDFDYHFNLAQIGPDVSKIDRAHSVTRISFDDFKFNIHGCRFPDFVRDNLLRLAEGFSSNPDQPVARIFSSIDLKLPN